jgi:hypothetical protein
MNKKVFNREIGNHVEYGSNILFLFHIFYYFLKHKTKQQTKQSQTSYTYITR